MDEQSKEAKTAARKAKAAEDKARRLTGKFRPERQVPSLIGWTVQARKRDKHGSLTGTYTNVSSPMETRAGAQSFLELWKQKYPDLPAHITEVRRQPLTRAKKKGKALAVNPTATQREIF